MQMSEILVKVHHFNFKNDAAKFKALSDKLQALNFIPHTEPKIVARPPQGELTVDALDYFYMSDTGVIIYDWLIMPGRAGYYLELPLGCRPAPADPSQPAPDPHAGMSACKRAVYYMLEHKCSAYAAAKACNSHASAVYTTLARMQASGEI